jgi:hypothetical protein
VQTLLVVFGVGILLVPLTVYIIVAVRRGPSADQQADELLRAVLTPEEYHQLILEGHVDIPSPSDPVRVYRGACRCGWTGS